jgi:hypothetical protein
MFRAYASQHDNCEKCKKPSSESDPVIQLTSSTRVDGHHCIYIHVSCFCKAAGGRIEKYPNGGMRVYFHGVDLKAGA